MKNLAALLLLVATTLVHGEELPKEWHGTWTGQLVISGPSGSPAPVPMSILIVPIEGGKVQWRMIYDPTGKKLVKDYQLKPGENGKFVMDEKNGIDLPGRLIDDTLYFVFKVNDTLLDTRYRRNGDTLTMELTTCDPAKGKSTGPSQAKVSTLETLSVQKAILKRVMAP